MIKNYEKLKSINLRKKITIIIANIGNCLFIKKAYRDDSGNALYFKLVIFNKVLSRQKVSI